MSELGKSFFLRNVEYKVSFLRPPNSICAEPIDEKNNNLPDMIVPRINDKFMIDNQSYMITYVNSQKKRDITIIKRITAIPLEGGY